MKKEVKFKAFLDSEIDKILEQLGVLELVDAGGIKCAFCEKPISRDTISGFFVKGGQIKFCCNRIECSEKLAASQLKESIG